MGQIKDVFRSCKELIRMYPSYLIVMTLSIVTGVVESYLPVFLVKKIVIYYNNNLEVYNLVLLIGISFLILGLLYVIDNFLNMFFRHIRRMFLVKESIMFYRHLANIDYAYHENPAFLNDYTRALEDSVENIYDTADGLFSLIKTLIMSASLFLAFREVGVNVILIALLIAIIFGILRYFSSKLQYIWTTKKRPYRRMIKYNNRIFSLKDSMAELKMTDLDELLVEKNNEAHDEIIKATDKYFIPKAILAFISNLLLLLLYPFLIIVIAYQNGTIDNNTIANITSLSVAATTISTLIASIVRSIGTIQNSVIECKIPFELLKMKGTIEQDRGKEVGKIEEIELKNVSFSYTKESYQLENINMKIKKGDHIAIVGSNGAGKSTLVKLLLRLYDISDGDIYFNNLNYKEINPKSLRKEIGAVFQNIDIFACTIAENVLLRKVETKEDIKKIEEALEFAGLKEDIDKLPQGINTIVTKEFDKDGIVFSVGQAQKLSIARAYAGDYSLLILDEPSSALDPIAEEKIYERISLLGKNKTIIFISHRLTTTINADYIYLFGSGKILECGTHDQLMEKNGLYKKMFSSQAYKYLGGKDNEQ